MNLEGLMNNAIVDRIGKSLLIILIVAVIWIIVSKMTKAYRTRKNGGTPLSRASSLKSVISDVIKGAIILLVVLTILQINGVDVTSLIAGLGVVGAVVGLALQDFLKDIIMGIHILIDGFFDIGDLIQYENEEGVVVSFNLRTTKIKSVDDDDIITICNRNIMSVVKRSGEVYIHFPMPYELKASDAEAAIAEMISRVKLNANTSDQVLADTGHTGDVPNRSDKSETHKIIDSIYTDIGVESIADVRYLGTTGFENSYIDYLIVINPTKPELYKRARRAFLRISQDVLDEKNIAIPFDQIDVHVGCTENRI